MFSHIWYYILQLTLALFSTKYQFVQFSTIFSKLLQNVEILLRKRFPLFLFFLLPKNFLPLSLSRIPCYVARPMPFFNFIGWGNSKIFRDFVSRPLQTFPAYNNTKMSHRLTKITKKLIELYN